MSLGALWVLLRMCILRVREVKNLLGDLSDVFSVLPAGEHVSKCKWLQSCMNQVGLWRLLFVLLCTDTKTQSKESKGHKHLFRTHSVSAVHLYRELFLWSYSWSQGKWLGCSFNFSCSILHRLYQVWVSGCTDPLHRKEAALMYWINGTARLCRTFPFPNSLQSW